MQKREQMRFTFNRVLFITLVLMVSMSIMTPTRGEAQKVYDDLFQASFPNEKEGWAAGRWGCILHTPDGGKTWVRQETGTDFTLSSVSFVDSKRGWAVGDMGTIIHTEDGGKTWEKQKSPVSFFHMKVQFVSPLKGWIVSEQTHILITEDGGKTWTVQFKDQDIILKSLSFCDPLHGWAVGEYGYIYHTRNGGAKWEQQAGKFGVSEKTGDVEGGNFLFDVVAVDSQNAWAVGIEGYVIRTVNGGKSWQEVKTGAPKTQLFCVNTDKAKTILIGGNGFLLASLDNGKTWKEPEFKPSVIYDWLYGITRLGGAGFLTVGGGGGIYLSEANPPGSWKKIEY